MNWRPMGELTPEIAARSSILVNGMNTVFGTLKEIIDNGSLVFVGGWLHGWRSECCKWVEIVSEREQAERQSTHQVNEVTWNDDGTMTLVVQGYSEPVKAGDFITCHKA